MALGEILMALIDRCVTFGPGDWRYNWACGIFSDDHAYVAWELMTYGGVKVEFR